MIANVNVVERTWMHEPEEWTAWLAGDRKGYPRDRRLKFWRGSRAERQPKHQFGETYVATALMRQGFLCWTWFCLFGEATRSSSRRRNTEELRRLLKASGREIDPESIPALVAGPAPLRAPDIVAYHPRHQAWRFVEVKRPGDRLAAGQQLALAALKHFLDVDAEVARLIPRPVARAGDKVLTTPLPLSSAGVRA